MLSINELEGLHDDGFEGSIDERRIFTEVFFGNNGCQTSNRCLVTGVINFETEYSKHMDPSLCSNSENSAVTSQEDSCNVKEDCGRNAGPGSLAKRFALLKRKSDDVNVKRLKLSVDELSNAKSCLRNTMHSSACLKVSDLGKSEPVSNSVYHTVTCHLVESSSHGVTSSCYLLKRHVEVDGGGDKDVSRCGLSSVDRNVGKEVIAYKAIASPVSQESFATKLLVASPSVTVANNSESLRYAKKKWNRSNFLEVDLDKMPLKRESMNDPRPLLRNYTNHLLRAAGWEIGRRKREHTVNGEYVYRSPQGQPIREFRRAWELCGQSLFSVGDNVVQEIDGKQWTDITQFLSDLSKTVIKIEEKLNKSQTSNALLAHLWCLLDPFACVVFIDKKVSSLRAGKVVKAKRCLAVNMHMENDAVLALTCVDNIGKQFTERHLMDRLHGSSPCTESALTVFDENHCIHDEQCGNGSSADFEQLQRGQVKAPKCMPPYFSKQHLYPFDDVTINNAQFREISDEEKRSLVPSSFPAYCSDVICDQSSSGLYEVPVTSANANVIRGESETVSPHQDSNTSSPSYHRHSSDHDEDMPLEVVKRISMHYSDDECRNFESKADKVKNKIHWSLEDHANCTNGCRTQFINMDDTLLKQHSGHSEREVGQCSEASAFRMDGTSFEEDILLKNGAYRKSKKISEMKLSKLYQNDGLLLSTYKSKQDNIDESSFQLKSGGVQKYFIPATRTDGSYKKSSLCSSQHWGEKQLGLKKVNCNPVTSKKLVQASREGTLPKELNFYNDNDEAHVHVKGEFLDSQTWRQVNKSKMPEIQDEIGQKKSSTCQLKDDDLLISAIIKTKSFRSSTKQSTPKMNSCKSKALRKRRSQKGSCRLLPRSLGKGGKNFMDGKWPAYSVRTVLSWLIDSGIVSLNEVIQYRNPKDDAVIKDGLVTLDGISCKCCSKVLSVSEFKIHAGHKLNRHCLNLFMESGKPFTLCQLEAWSAEYKARRNATHTVQVDEMDQNDDSCGLCGDGGELICCDNCPSTFHRACLYAKELPEGSWYCRNCTCRICECVVDDKGASKSPGALKCSQCEHKYHEACLKEKSSNGGVASGTWFCGKSCQEVYSGLQSRVGLTNFISDGFSWTLLRCIHGDQRFHTAQKFVALKAECNSKLAVALTIMEECFLSMVDPRTGIDMIPHVIYNWGSTFARLDYHGFYTVVLEKDDVLISVASIRIHGVLVAEMPLIATCSKYRRHGMCRRLMNSIEEMLKSFKVKKLVISAIPNLVKTWTEGFGFKPLEEDEIRSLSNINLMVFPGTVWLKKVLYENQETYQQTESCHLPPLQADYPTDMGTCSGGTSVVESAQQSNGNVYVKEVDAGTKVESQQPNGNSFVNEVDAGMKVESQQSNCNSFVNEVDAGMKVKSQQSNGNSCINEVDAGTKVESAQQNNGNSCVNGIDAGSKVEPAQISNGSSHVNEVAAELRVKSTEVSNGSSHVNEVATELRVESTKLSNGSSHVNEVDAETKIKHHDCKNSVADVDQDGHLDEIFSKLSCEESASMLGENPLEVACHLELGDVLQSE